MKISQITPGRFHHFHLARQLEKYQLLEKIYTGYPKFKLSDENGIPKEKIQTYPWYQTVFMAKGKIGLGNWEWFGKELAWQAKEALDKYASKNLTKETTHVIALSGSGLQTGHKIKQNGGVYICDRGSSHIVYQNNILHEENERFGIKFNGIDPRVIEKELKEYDLADFITVPSEFVRQSFIDHGISSTKLIKIPYGARLDRFSKVAEPCIDTFRVLWVGAVSIRKGFLYALEAFQQLQHPKKEFIVIGSLTEEIKTLIAQKNLEDVLFKGTVPNYQLAKEYSQAHVFVLPSLEEGFGMVLGEALACGCPVIASTNTGGSDLFEDGKEGFIVPIRNSQIIADKLQLLADDQSLRQKMSMNAISCVKNLGGWDHYGSQFDKFLKQT